MKVHFYVKFQDMCDANHPYNIQVWLCGTFRPVDIRAQLTSVSTVWLCPSAELRRLSEPLFSSILIKVTIKFVIRSCFSLLPIARIHNSVRVQEPLDFLYQLSGIGVHSLHC